jgi:hypothetical protein
MEFIFSFHLNIVSLTNYIFVGAVIYAFAVIINKLMEQ